MNKEPTEQLAPPNLDATFSAMTLLEMLKIISADTAACAAMAREAASLSVMPEGGYERALGVYMGLLGISGKVAAMLSAMSPEVESLLATEALAIRDRTHATCH